MKKIIRKILREEIDKSDRHYKILDKISEHVQLPYFKSMEGLTIYDKDDQEYILNKLYGDGNISEIYFFNKEIIDFNGHLLYREGGWGSGHWVRFEYDGRGNKIYHEDSRGWWKKYEYDNRNNQIYYEDSNGNWKKQEYDDNGNKIYSEDSTGWWRKFVYDDRGNKIYKEHSDGYWEKYGYDNNGNVIYYENSHGKIIDRR